MRLRPFVFVLLGAALSASGAAAHVNWFVDSAATPLPNYSVTEPAFLLWAAVAVALVGVSVWLDGKLPVLTVPDSKTRHDFMELLRVFTGMSFLLTAYDGALVAPHKVVEGAFGVTLLFTQAIIGIMLIANRYIKTAAYLMIALHIGVAIEFGVLSALEYGILVGIAVFLIFNNIKDDALRERLKLYSVDALRISAGISLIALAFGEKLGPSALGQVFVAQYQWNFMQMLGFGIFDDRLFVLAAGMVEAALGIVLLIGTTTRLAVLVLSMMMALSNIVFILQGNNEAALVELIGHMPIIGTALVLLLLGYGQRLKFTDLLRGTQRAQAARA